MNAHAWHRVLILFVVAAPLGCGPQPPTQPANPPQPARQPDPAPKTTPAEDPSFTLIKIVTDESRPWDERIEAAEKFNTPFVPKVAVPEVVAGLKKIKDDRLAVHVAVGILWADPDSEPALDALLKCLRSTDSVTQVWATQFFMFRPIHPPKVVPALTATLKDRKSDVRAMAAQSLESYRADAASAVPALVEALGDSDGDVRLHAVQALGDIGKAAIPKLQEVLKSEKRDDVRRRAEQALDRIR